jgi:hypothetical protein
MKSILAVIGACTVAIVVGAWWAWSHARADLFDRAIEAVTREGDSWRVVVRGAGMVMLHLKGKAFRAAPQIGETIRDYITRAQALTR